MNLQKSIRRVYLYSVYGLKKAAGTGAFGKNRVEYVNGNVPAGGNLLKSALCKHHVKQFHGASCSVASVVSVVNSLKALQSDTSVPISQMDLLDTVNTADWKARMLDKDYKKRRGLPLPVLGEVVKASLDVHGISYKTIKTIPAFENPGRSANIRSVLRDRLCDFEIQGNCVIIAHFDQGVYVPTLNIPHISPVGGFDDKAGKVLVLDVDPEEERHYWIGFDRFYQGLSSNCHRLIDSSGFGRGGYVFVSLS
jgi:hypothetical protein